MIGSTGFRAGYLLLVLFTLLAGDAWRYSVGWWGFGVIAVAITSGAVALLIRDRERWRIGDLPYPLIAFLVLTAASIAWSHYPLASALGVLTTWMTITIAVALAVVYSWQEILDGLGTALRIILGLSLLFEFVVSVFIRSPVLPLVPAPGIDYTTLEEVPKLLYWSRNELFEVFEGGEIQGIVGNASLLAFIALLGLIVFGVQSASRNSRRPSAVLWLALSILTVLLTASATVLLAIVACSIVLGAVLLLRRLSSDGARRTVYLALTAAAGLGIALGLALRSPLLELLGKSDTLTGRVEIWQRVAELAQKRAAFGWGWVSYWAPWVEPFDDLVFRNGVRQLHAHNAWLDIWFQLGIVGLIVFGALVLSTSARAWTFAIDRQGLDRGPPGHHSALTLLPVLVLVALLVQSIAESRLIVEYGLLLLGISSVKTRLVERQPRE